MPRPADMTDESSLLGGKGSECVDIGLGRCNDNVGIRALPVHNAASLFQPDRYLSLRICTTGDVTDGIKLQLGLAMNNGLDCPECRVNRTAAF